MNDSKTMSKIFTADQPQNTKDSSIKRVSVISSTESEHKYLLFVF